MRYAVVIEKADGNYSAYVPDLPGCVATGDTVAAVEGEIREAMRFHIEGAQGRRLAGARARPASQTRRDVTRRVGQGAKRRALRGREILFIV